MHSNTAGPDQLCELLNCKKHSQYPILTYLSSSLVAVLVQLFMRGDASLLVLGTTCIIKVHYDVASHGREKAESMYVLYTITLDIVILQHATDVIRVTCRAYAERETWFGINV